MVRAVESAGGSASDTPDLMFQFGALLAYSFALGIQDLHKENVVLAAHGPQPIDAEVVLSQIRLPDETQLLKRRSENPDDTSFLQSIRKNSNDLLIDDFTQLIDGFLQMFLWVARHADEISDIIETTVKNEVTPVKVRALLRSTKIYRDHLNFASKFEFLPEEKLQLERGDIPYFFRHFDDPAIYYMTSRTTSQAVKLHPTIPGLKTTPILKIEKLINELLPQSLLYLLKHHADRTWRGQFESNGFRFSSLESDFLIENDAHSYQATR